MKLLATISDQDVGADYTAEPPYKEREAARAVVFDSEGKVALLHARNVKFHKLPGGGFEEGEDAFTALRREVKEEIGCEITNIRELGLFEEYRNQWNLHQVSYVYLADVDGEKGEPNLMDDEIEDGFETVWMSLDEAIATIASEAPVEDYEGKFIQHRDLALLTEAQRYSS